MKTRILSANESPSGGKPTFLTWRFSELSGVLGLKASQRETTLQIKPALGWEGGLAPAKPSLPQKPGFTVSKAWC